MCVFVCVCEPRAKKKKKEIPLPTPLHAAAATATPAELLPPHTHTNTINPCANGGGSTKFKKKTAASAATTNCKGQKNPKYTTMCSKTRCNRRRAKGGSEGVDSSTHCHRKRGNRRADDAQPKKPNEFCLSLYVCVCVRARKCVRFCVCECVRSFFCNFNLLLLFTSGGWVEGTGVRMGVEAVGGYERF